MQSYTVPTKPADCFEALTVVDNGCGAVQLSEIRQMIISNANSDGSGAAHAPSGDESLLASWAGVIDNATADAAKQLTGMGDIPTAPETTVVANGYKQPIVKERVINFDINVVGADTEAFLRKLQYGFKGYVWLVTRGGTLIGGQTGIYAVCTSAEPGHARGNEAVKTWTTIWNFYAQVSPPEVTSPFTVFN